MGTASTWFGLEATQSIQQLLNNFIHFASAKVPCPSSLVKMSMAAWCQCLGLYVPAPKGVHGDVRVWAVEYMQYQIFFVIIVIVDCCFFASNCNVCSIRM